GMVAPLPNTVIAGLDPAIHGAVAGWLSASSAGMTIGSSVASCEVAVEISPIRIVGLDQGDFPSARPFLQALLTLNGGSDVIERLDVDQELDAISLREPGNESLAVFEGAARDVVRHADVERAILAARHDVPHAQSASQMDRRVKP